MISFVLKFEPSRPRISLGFVSDLHIELLVGDFSESLIRDFPRLVHELDVELSPFSFEKQLLDSQGDVTLVQDTLEEIFGLLKELREMSNEYIQQGLLSETVRGYSFPVLVLKKEQNTESEIELLMQNQFKPISIQLVTDGKALHEYSLK